MNHVLIEKDGGVATLWLNRPDLHNAFDDGLIAEVTQAIDSLANDTSARVVIVAGKGKSFSAGADLGWMKRMAGYSLEQNQADANCLAEMLHRLNTLAKPTIAAVQGAAMGGGVGLCAACDIGIAASDAVFALSEAKLGLIPAVISPYVIEAIGARAARRYMLTAERFDAATAERLGLVSAVVAPDQLMTEARRIADILLQNGPQAVREAKLLVAHVGARPNDAALRAETAKRIARLRATEEGREGVAAFLEKRKPAWRNG
ncbi:MAG TPA: enoyl-CoA hydratase/isomerase family protein [Dongiaceae bacterium]|jgi:methylglutaconyl-CoA hydratase